MNLTKTSRAAAMLAAATVVTGMLLPTAIFAAESVFTDSRGDHDLANAANWSPSTWTSDDSLTVSSANFTFQDEGLVLSRDMETPSARIFFKTLPNKNVTVDFGGHSLNTKYLRIQEMHNDANRNYYLKATGGFSGLERIYVNDSAWTANHGHVRFYDGTYSVKRGVILRDWYAFLYVCSGAELVFEDVNSDGGVKIDSSASKPEFVIDGGKVVILNHSGSDPRWQRTFWQSHYQNKGVFKILNGGEFRDDSTMPGDTFVNINVTIKDSGYYETNSAYAVRNTGFFGVAKYEVTNSVFRVAQLYLGQYNSGDSTYGYEVSDYNLANSTVDFCDSEETFAFRPGSSRTTAGMVVPSTARNNTIKFRGDRNRFTSKTFILGGSNTVAVTGGRFDVSNSFAFVTAKGGEGSTLILKDVDAYLGAVTASAAATNTTVEISGTANVKGNGDFATGGPGSAMRVTDDAVLAIGAHKFSLQGDGSELLLGGLVSTGAVWFTASGCTATLAATTNRTALGSGWSRLAPVWFAANKANNVLVISNATYDCQGPAFKEMVQNTGDGLNSEARAFTQCPGCRIEFRGSCPEFIVSNTKTSGDSGNAWFSMAFGEMYDATENRYTQAYYPLDNPVRLRFVLPPSTEVYAQAPIRSSNGIVVLGGNAEFEFDMSEFDWPQGRFIYPLVYNGTGFKGSSGGVTRTYIDIDKLNETNAARMPVDKYGNRAGKFALSADGKTLNLVVSNPEATLFYVR